MGIRSGLQIISLFIVGGCASAHVSLEGDYRHLPFRLVGSGIPVVTAKINNKEAWFIIDTGASATLISKAIAKYFGLYNGVNFQKIEREINGLGGSITVESAVYKLQLGELIINHPVLISKDLNALLTVISKTEEITIAGILGSDFLLRYGVIINYANRTVMYSLTDGLSRLVIN
jgi:hypothetical protein